MLTKASGPRSQFSLYGPTISWLITYLFFCPTDKHIKGQTRGKAVQGVFHKKDL